MIFLGTPQLRGGVHFSVCYKVSFAKHSSVGLCVCVGGNSAFWLIIFACILLHLHPSASASFQGHPNCRGIKTPSEHSKHSGNFPDWLKNCSDWKVSRRTKNFQTVWTVLSNSGNFSDCPESFQKVWKLSGGQSDSPESFQTVWKVSRQSEKFPCSLNSF